MERRFTSGGTSAKVETRDDGKKVLVGIGAVFYREGKEGTEYQLGRSVVERIADTAFDEALSRNDDARGLFNHNPDHLLGRVSSGTMRLRKEGDGLAYEIDLPDTQTARDVEASIERGDLTGSSFAFTVDRATWIEEEERDIRQIDSVKLFDVGPVTYPAYEGTTTGLRSDDDASEAMESLKRHKERKARSKRLQELERSEREAVLTSKSA